jgi:hypothetical protein
MVRVIVEVVLGPQGLVPAGTVGTAELEVEVATPLSVSAAVISETGTMVMIIVTAARFRLTNSGAWNKIEKLAA